METEIKNLLTEWLDEALKKKNLKPLAYKFFDADIKGGYVAKMERVEVTVENMGIKETLEVVVKSSSANTFADACLNEANFYSKILPHFDKFAGEKGVEKFRNIPECYGVSTSDNHVAVVLENLISKKFQIREYTPFNSDHLKLLLEVIAKFHAFSFALNDQKPQVFHKLGKRNIKLDEWKIVELTVVSFEEQMDYLIGVYEERNELKVLDKLKMLRKNYRKMMENFLNNQDEDYLVLAHADIWNNNIFFKYNEKSKPIDAKIVDWQTAVIGSPMIDVIQLFFFCCFKKELENLHELLSFYHETLSSKIRQLGSDPEKCFPREACFKAFKRYAPLGIAGIPFLLRMYYNSNNDGAESVTTETGDFGAILADDVTDMEAFFGNVNDLLELCIERGLI